ncbi:MAG: hypothetical protein IIY11_06595 [Clostridia bacterium]|nr:hypothetical protein [Clostridia bacterium]
MKKEKKSIDVLSIICGLILFVFFAFIISHVFFYPQTHGRERRRVENVAKEYIEQKRPYFVTDEVNAVFSFLPSCYYVECIDEYGKVLELYIETDGTIRYEMEGYHDVDDIRWRHEGPIKVSIEKELAEKTDYSYYNGVRIRNIDFDKGLVSRKAILSGYDMSNDRMGCVVSLTWDEGETKEDVCEKMIVIKDVVMNIKEHNIVQVDFDLYGPDWQGYLSYPMGQENVTAEELVGLIGYLVEFKK